MAESIANPLAYYASQSTITEPGEHVGLLKGLPAEIPDLVRIVQNNLIHIFWLQGYNLDLPAERKQEVQICRVSTMLSKIAAVDNRLLTIPRPQEKRLVANCRHFSVMLATLLRHQGIPARARCGFAAYFIPDHFEDHWVCEVWNADEKRWVLVDAQLDEMMIKALNIPFNTLDVPRDQFIVGSEMWLKCRAGEVDPDRCGIMDMQGLWFVLGDARLDIAALNKVELLPWDSAGPLLGDPTTADAETLAFLDRAMNFYPASNERFADLRALYESEPRLRVPTVIKSFPNGPEPIDVDLSAPEVLAPAR